MDMNTNSTKVNIRYRHYSIVINHKNNYYDEIFLKYLLYIYQCNLILHQIVYCRNGSFKRNIKIISTTQNNNNKT